MASQLNKIAYITGSSKGIGEALANKLLNNGYVVVGLSRTQTFEAENFTHIQLNLNDLNAVKAFEFLQNADQVLLVNNAGIIGEIAPVGQVANQSLQDVLTINTIAPQILINNFMKRYLGKIAHGHILNISSGAGKNPIDAWASYCSSKAALDMFSETVKTELQLREIVNWYIHSVAPGVVDTDMQKQIRNANPVSFKLLNKFIALKKEQQLALPNAVANKLYAVIQNPSSFKETIISVRNF